MSASTSYEEDNFSLVWRSSYQWGKILRLPCFWGSYNISSFEEAVCRQWRSLGQFLSHTFRLCTSLLQSYNTRFLSFTPTQGTWASSEVINLDQENHDTQVVAIAVWVLVRFPSPWQNTSYNQLLRRIGFCGVIISEACGHLALLICG